LPEVLEHHCQLFEGTNPHTLILQQGSSRSKNSSTTTVTAPGHMLFMATDKEHELRFIRAKHHITVLSIPLEHRKPPMLPNSNWC
jgi:hypothetical protein